MRKDSPLGLRQTLNLGDDTLLLVSRDEVGNVIASARQGGETILFHATKKKEKTALASRIAHANSERIIIVKIVLGSEDEVGTQDHERVCLGPFPADHVACRSRLVVSFLHCCYNMMPWHTFKEM